MKGVHIFSCLDSECCFNYLEKMSTYLNMRGFFWFVFFAVVVTLVVCLFRPVLFSFFLNK